jgi:hypothetical protein
MKIIFQKIITFSFFVNIYMDRRKNKQINIDLTIKEFNMSWIKPDSVCVYIAKRNSGKSTLIKDTLFYHQDIPIVTVISESEEVSPFFSKFVPPIFIHHQYTPELMSNIIQRQSKILKTIHDNKLSSEDLDPRNCVIMDDCLANNNVWIKDVNIKRIFMNGRHLKIFYLLTMQYPLGIPPHLRAQVDWVFLLRDNNKKNIVRLYDYYAAFFPCYEIFEQVYYKLTENYGCMVINCNSRSSNIEDCVFKYRAQMHENFTMCNKEFWEQSACINNDVSVSNSIHINDLNSNSTKFKININ